MREGMTPEEVENFLAGRGAIARTMLEQTINSTREARRRGYTFNQCWIAVITALMEQLQSATDKQRSDLLMELAAFGFLELAWRAGLGEDAE